MATFLDVGLVQSFGVIFPVLFVFCLVFALLQKTKALGESLAINAIIAVAVAFMILLSETIIKIVNFVIPWFAVAIIFFVLLLLIFQLFGASDKDIFKALQNDPAITWVIIGIGIIIIIAAFASVLGQKFTEASFQSGTAVNASIGGVGTTDFQQNIYATLFHPKVLGLIVLFAIAIFAVALLTHG